MESAIVLNEADVKKILASYFHVEEKQVIKAKYSYTIVGAKASEIFAVQQND